MKLLFLSSLCSTPLLPNLSPGNARILRALRTIADCRVIIPVFPARHAGAAGEIPAVEVEQDGSPIFHPRIFHIPGVARFLNGVFYTLSVAPMVYAEVARFRPDVILSPWCIPTEPPRWHWAR